MTGRKDGPTRRTVPTWATSELFQWRANGEPRPGEPKRDGLLGEGLRPTSLGV